MRLQEGVLVLSNKRRLRRFVLATILCAFTLTRGCSAQFASLQGKDACSLCPDGSDFEFPEAFIPFFVLPSVDHPRCADLARLGSMVPHDSTLCKNKIQVNAGYCGCPGVEKINQCTFCPNGDVPEKFDQQFSTGETCGDLHKYVSYFDEEKCGSIQYDGITRNAYECGCDVSLRHIDLMDVTPRQASFTCSLCPGGLPPPEDEFFLEMAGLTCGEYASFIDSLDPEQCEVQSRRGTFQLFAFQCNCPNTSPPACPKKENPELCTVSLLNTVDKEEQCECYSFCDGEFVGCEKYPGYYLGDKCPGTRVSGCNYASAIDDVNGNDTEIEDGQPCGICPDGSNNIRNPTAILPPFSGLTIPGFIGQPTCQDLVDHFRNERFDDEDCQVAKARVAHFCGCDGVEPNCTLCPGGIQPSFANKIATEEATCEEFAGTVLTWEAETCEIGESYLSVMGARCGCITANFPVCPVQQYPMLCTTNLLRSAEEECECYNFCGDQFHSCSDYPGTETFGESDCPDGATPIGGCNAALATSQRCRRGSIDPFCEDDLALQEPLRHNLRH